MIKLDDYLRIIESMRRHEMLQMISLHKEHGVSEQRVSSKSREIIVNLPVEVSPSAANIPLGGAAREVKPPDNGCRG